MRNVSSLEFRAEERTTCALHPSVFVRCRSTVAQVCIFLSVTERRSNNCLMIINRNQPFKHNSNSICKFNYHCDWPAGRWWRQLQANWLSRLIVRWFALRSSEPSPPVDVVREQSPPALLFRFCCCRCLLVSHSLDWPLVCSRESNLLLMAELAERQQALCPFY